MLPSPVGERLRAARELVESEKLSARELSALAGVSPALVGHLETGRVSMPGTDTLVALADVLGLSVEWLAAGRGDAPTAEAVSTAVARARAARVEPRNGTEG